MKYRIKEYVNKDGNTMYFVSNMKGTLGDADIFRVKKIQQKNKKGEMEWVWSEPENLGPKINTPGKEMFPYVDSRGVLFFASDGLVGFGGSTAPGPRLPAAPTGPTRN